jgi:hypothetical protein
MLDAARPEGDEPDGPPPSSEGSDPLDEKRRQAGADLRTALAGDDDLEVFAAWNH